MITTPRVTVRAERRFAVVPERLFDAWLDPALISQWMFGPALRDEQVLRIEVDGRVGGTFSFLVRRDGEALNYVGRYLLINRPRRLVFTWGIEGQSEDQSRVMVDFLPVTGGCDLALTHDLHPRWADEAARLHAGWIDMLDRLAALLKSGAE